MENKNPPNMEAVEAAVTQDFLEAEREKDYQERLAAENYLLMGGYSDRTDVVNQVQELVDALTRQSKTISTQMSTIQEQEMAIVMLRDYILKNNLPPFWNINRGQHNKVDVSFIDKMEMPELLTKNKEISNKYRRATSQDTTPFPTVEELEERYKRQVSPEAEALIGAIANSKKTSDFPPSGDDDVSPFGMSDED